MQALTSTLAEVRPLTVDALRVRYRSAVAVDGVSFSVDSGLVVGLLGPNGCGKTSTLRAVVGLLRADAGTVVVNGVAQPSRSARAQLAYVPDEPDGLDELCVTEYLSLVRALWRADAGYDARAHALCGAFVLRGREQVRLGALSHGQRRIVSIVAALALAKPLLVVDEANAALDPEASLVLREALQATSSAVLVATQDLAFAERVCDDVVLLNRGEIVARGATRALAPLEDAYLGALGAGGRLEEVRAALRNL